MPFGYCALRLLNNGMIFVTLVYQPLPRVSADTGIRIIDIKQALASGVERADSVVKFRKTAVNHRQAVN